MISPSDEDYQDTKRIKRGEKTLSARFERFEAWLNKNYDTQVMHIRFEHTKHEHRPRLNLIFEYDEQIDPFREGPIGYKKDVLTSILTAFKKMYTTDKDLSDLFIIFSAFDRVARAEANGAIPRAEIEALKQRLALEELWKISPFFSFTDFMLYTDQQVEAFEKNGMKEKLSRAYLEVLKPYDEFGYFDKETFFIHLDSKENFDTNYESNWYYFYK